MVALEVFLSAFIVAYITYQIASLGGLFAEKSGTVNIGIEGQMVGGAFGYTAFVTFCANQGVDLAASAWPFYIGLLFAAGFGLLFSLILAIPTIHMNADHTIVGTALNMIAPAFSMIMVLWIFGSDRLYATLPPDFLVIGDFQINWHLIAFLVIAIVITVVGWMLVNKTRFGLRLRASGENPHALAAAGVSVVSMRYAGIMISGLLAGLAGAFAIQSFGGMFNGTVRGMGFIAIAVLIMGAWKVGGIAIASIGFGFVTALAAAYQSLVGVEWLEWMSAIPSEFFSMLPFILPLVVLMIVKSSGAPAASGKPYDKQERT